MNCEQSSQVQAYYDDELPASMRATVERHLAECGSCGELLADLRAMSRELTEMTGVSRPAMSVDARRRLEQAWWAARDRGVLRLAEWLTAAAAAILVGALLFWSDNGTHQNRMAEAPVANVQAMNTQMGNEQTDVILPPVEARDEVASNDVDLAEWIASDLSVDPAH